MKVLITLVLVSFFGVAAGAQNNAAPAQPSQPAAAVPAQAAPAQPAAAAPAPTEPAMPAAVAQAPAETKETFAALKKKHIDAVAELRKRNIDEIQALKAGMKGKPAAEIRKAVEAKRAEHKTALKALHAANKAEMAQFKKDHPEMMKKMGKGKADKKH